MPAFSSLTAALFTDGPAPDRAEKMGLYGWLIGDWEMDTKLFAEDGTATPGSGEIHFGWALQGRAIQDVWILPGAFFGTTLRIYDPGLDAWHILWHDPLKQLYTRQLGRAEGGTSSSSARPRTAPPPAGASARSRPMPSSGGPSYRTMASATGACLAEFRARRV